MKKIVIAVMLAGCAYGKTPPDPGLASPTPQHDPPSGLCCQEVNWYDTTYGPLRLECDADSGTQYTNFPWVCNYDVDSGNAQDCHNSSCVVGSNCMGPNGTGVVIACDQVIY